ncbi:MAG: FeoA family protein [Nitrososphaerales archaeon]|jgi:Fe2+ transport system protein FeoA|nr:FeoA family protein [Nitrososphaerales archaeon]
MNKKKSQQNNHTKITELNVGERCKVINLETSNETRLQKLLSMGILPGRHIEILQKVPSYILQVGQTQYAIDKEIADAIYIEQEKS